MASFFGLGDNVRVLRELSRHISHPCTLEVAKARIQQRLARRDQLFLQAVHDVIWQQPSNPYRQLLEWAGWSPGTLEESVGRRGVEGTLQVLRDDGVYVSHEEFKARKPIHRGQMTIVLEEGAFNNPLVVPMFEAQSSGTRGRASRVPATFNYVAEQRAAAWRVTLEAIGAGNWPMIVWMPSVRHGGGPMWWLSLAHMGRPALRWFSITETSPSVVPRQTRLMYRFGQVIGRLHGLRIPYPEYMPFERADTVLDVLLDARRRYGGCALTSSPSAATRVAVMALQRGVSLEDVVFLVGGEPLTHGKYQDITRTGARVASRYSFIEAGALASACGRPHAIDDMHFARDSFGLVTDLRMLPDGRAATSLLFTTLLASSPRVMLNVESDDFGTVSEEACGCIWDELGLHTHLSGIMSFSKLTGEGVTVLGTNCVRVLEEELPREFGGRSVDYQLLEAEDDNHLTRLYLVVSPSVGPVDEQRVLTRFVEQLQAQSGPRGAMPPLWRLAQTLRVVRRAPVPTAGGKLLPFHTLASSPNGTPTATEPVVPSQTANP